jgi:hypothetical protein
LKKISEKYVQQSYNYTPTKQFLKMNAKKAADPNSNLKASVEKKSVQKTRKIVPVKFDKEGFYLAWGIGIVVTGVGVLLMWAVRTAPPGESKLLAPNMYQRIASLLPHSTKDTIAFWLGAAFAVFGVFCLLLGLKLVFQYLRNKMRQ